MLLELVPSRGILGTEYVVDRFVGELRDFHTVLRPELFDTPGTE